MILHYRLDAAPLARRLRCYWIDESVINQPEVIRSQRFAAYRLTKELNMIEVFLLIASVVAVGLYFVVAPAVLSTYRRYRGRRAIICPETDQIANGLE